MWKRITEQQILCVSIDHCVALKIQYLCHDESFYITRI